MTNVVSIRSFMFQHTAARRRLLVKHGLFYRSFYVSTHSRPKAAAKSYEVVNSVILVSTHSRPKAAALVIFIVV